MSYPTPKDGAVSLRMKRNLKTESRPEIRLRSALHARGLRFRKNHLIRLDSLAVRPDVVFSGPRVAVFVDGCFWHRCPEHGTTPRFNADYWRKKLDRNVARDKRADFALATAGWTTVRVWEHEDPIVAAHAVEEICQLSRSS